MDEFDQRIQVVEDGRTDWLYYIWRRADGYYVVPRLRYPAIGLDDAEDTGPIQTLAEAQQIARDMLAEDTAEDVTVPTT